MCSYRKTAKELICIVLLACLSRRGVTSQLRGPDSAAVVIGGQFVMKCNITIPPAGPSPSSSLHHVRGNFHWSWTFNGMVIVHGPGCQLSSFELGSKYQTLSDSPYSCDVIISKIAFNDAGKYECSVDASEGARVIFHLVVLDRRVDCSTSHDADSVVNMKDLVNFKCSLRFNDTTHANAPRLVWSRPSFDVSRYQFGRENDNSSHNSHHNNESHQHNDHNSHRHNDHNSHKNHNSRSNHKSYITTKSEDGDQEDIVESMTIQKSETESMSELTNTVEQLVDYKKVPIFKSFRCRAAMLTLAVAMPFNFSCYTAAKHLLYPPENVTIVAPNSHYVRPNDQIACVAVCNPSCSYQWYYNNYTLLGRGQTLQVENSGSYSCLAVNMIEGKYSTSMAHTHIYIGRVDDSMPVLKIVLITVLVTFLAILTVYVTVFCTTADMKAGFYI
ncbi:hypothetical protein HELRODRAFT_174692 [Helobdella robusta]|uniref:Ig-like domain-containing protein n=1 Tax=Helobdella robusta TaxID=6412 RepID=T1F8D5_HELRO|nr:hypothetical protein HELRODRAFT_174692 [Helobdella robusta]ESO01717.1 hypothetical protein HELRODRAFT_174692 [Helobdella robusta]